VRSRLSALPIDAASEWGQDASSNYALNGHHSEGPSPIRHEAKLGTSGVLITRVPWHVGSGRVVWEKRIIAANVVAEWTTNDTWAEI